MPFTCAICVMDIGAGEPMLSDEKMNVAHEVCVRRVAAGGVAPTASVPSVTLLLPPALSTPPPFSCQRCGIGITTTAPHSCSRCYLDLCPKCEAAGCCGSRPAQRGEKTYCASCNLPCKSMCPVCRSYVHHSYGALGRNCGGLHETVCRGAKDLRLGSGPAEPKTPNPEKMKSTVSAGKKGRSKK